jgi:prolyl-tRNA editing enzyme YbaK/EbsC (Cys-tRNA(Pro) deacylase)
MVVGTLSFEPARTRRDLAAPVVADALMHEDIGVAPIDPALSDTAAFCAAYDVKPQECANCMILKTKKGEQRGFAAVVVLADTRADINGKVCEVLGIKKASFAQMEEAVALSHMEFGAITPVGLPKEWPILIDSRVKDAPLVIIGSGMRGSKLAMSGEALCALPGVQVVDGLAQPRG